MANIQVGQFAKILCITSGELLTEVKRIKGYENASLNATLTDEIQNVLSLKFKKPLDSNKTTEKPLQTTSKKSKEQEVMSEELSETKSKMELLYQYEKHYLELIKDYKEEIKFANSLQEDLRRERSQFFTQTLREVVQTLNDQQIDKTVASRWIEELVSSYTKSIDLSSDLAKTHVVQVLSLFKEEAKREVSKAKLDDLKPSTNAE